MVTLFYDGHCPLCMKEINVLRRYNQHQNLKLVDIHSPEFDTLYPQIDKQAADERLHAIGHNGQILTGLDANVAVWQAVGKHKWLRALRWPVIRWFADRGYRLFAKHRHTLAAWLTGQARCDQDSCRPPKH